MNISPINVITSLNKFNYQNKGLKNSPALKYDEVSFSGKEPSLNIERGVKIGEKILNLSKNNLLNYETLNNVLNENSPVPICIQDIRNIPNIAKSDFGKPIAHMLPGYTPDLKLAAANIYLGSLPKTPQEVSDFAANVAHEYTHVLQRAQDKTYYGIPNCTKNIKEITIIARSAKSIMDEMGIFCQQQLFHSENDIKTVLNSILNNDFSLEKRLGRTNFNKIIDTTAFVLAFQFNKNPEDIKTALKNFIIQESQNETDAYSVTQKVLEKSKHDPIIKAKRILSKEIYSYINKMVK